MLWTCLGNKVAQGQFYVVLVKSKMNMIDHNCKINSAWLEKVIDWGSNTRPQHRQFSCSEILKECKLQPSYYESFIILLNLTSRSKVGMSNKKFALKIFVTFDISEHVGVHCFWQYLLTQTCDWHVIFLLGHVNHEIVVHQLLNIQSIRCDFCYYWCDLISVWTSTWGCRRFSERFWMVYDN